MNPEWATFVDKAMKDVCATLGIQTTSPQPKCELYKLLVYEKGSQYVSVPNSMQPSLISFSASFRMSSKSF
jgi:hypothetical protein